MENKNKTIEDLNKQVWYRAVKAVYILSVVLFLAVVAFLGIVDGDSLALWFMAVIIIIAIVVRGTFYYIVLGKINPEK